MLTSKHCVAHVPINSAGTEIFTSGAPGQVTGANGTFPATQSGTWTVQPGNTANTTAWKVDGSAVTQPVSGTVTVTGTVGNAAGTAEIGKVNPGAATAGNPTANANTPFAVQGMVSDGTNLQRLLAPLALGDGVNGNNMVAVGSWLWNGTTWDRVPGAAATGALSRSSNWPTTVDTNSGNKSASTPRFVIATDQPNLTTPLNVNKAQVNGVATSTGAGAVGTGSQRVSVGQDTTTLAGSAPGTAGTPSANVVSVQGAASMTPLLTSSAAATTGGASVSFLQPAASDNAGVVKAGAGTLYGAVGFNNSVTTNYLRYYNATTGFAGCNSATNLIAQFQIPAAGGFSIQLPSGVAFATGLSICVTSGYATTDTTAATASAMSLTTVYK